MASRSRPPDRPVAGGTGTARAPGELRPHGVGRVRHRRVEHRVPLRARAGAGTCGTRGHELLGPDARRDRRAGTSVTPNRRASQSAAAARRRRAARRGGVAPLGARRRQGGHDGGAAAGRTGVPIEQSTMPPVVRARPARPRPVEALVGVGRRAMNPARTSSRRRPPNSREAGPARLVEHDLDTGGRSSPSLLAHAPPPRGGRRPARRRGSTGPRSSTTRSAHPQPVADGDAAARRCPRRCGPR